METIKNTKMEIIRVGMIGCGGIANQKHMPSLAKIEGVEMTAFFDSDPQRAKEAAGKYGSGEATVYTDLDQLLKDSSIEVVHICTPNKTHAKIAIAAMRAGKHVMCEKPMAATAGEAWEMVRVSKETGKKLSISYQNRFRPDSEYLHRACERGDLGEIYFAKAHALRRRAVPTWGIFLDQEAQGGGPLIDIGTHALDLTLWMMNNYRPNYAVGTTYHKFADQTETGNAFGEWDPKKFTVEDSAFGFVVMENGATIILESSWALNTLQTGEARTTLCGTRAGADMMDGLRINGCEFNRLYIKKPQLEAGGVDFFDGEEDSPGEAEARAWIRCLREGTEPVVKPEEAAVVTEILEGIYRSAESGQPYYFKKQ